MPQNGRYESNKMAELNDAISFNFVAYCQNKFKNLDFRCKSYMQFDCI